MVTTSQVVQKVSVSVVSPISYICIELLTSYLLCWSNSLLFCVTR
uniref:Uncharacterized protein n=1 Tax=Arundo donax TaxID=35708 RepID=A0A0A9AY23_ARUDO